MKILVALVIVCVLLIVCGIGGAIQGVEEYTTTLEAKKYFSTKNKEDNE